MITPLVKFDEEHERSLTPPFNFGDSIKEKFDKDFYHYGMHKLEMDRNRRISQIINRVILNKLKNH
jgi:hypothetical protein